MDPKRSLKQFSTNISNEGEEEEAHDEILKKFKFSAQRRTRQPKLTEPDRTSSKNNMLKENSSINNYTLILRFGRKM